MTACRNASRSPSPLALPRDADSLYDRGVIELNRGDYVAAQELFERALRREPEAAHIHYGLAATRARLGAIDTALKSLERALDLHCFSGAEKQQRTVQVRTELDAVRLDFSNFGQAENLESAAVGQDRVGPVDEFVQAAGRANDFDAGPD